MSKAESHKEESIVCCLCNEEIQPEISGWKFGHNPAPLGETEDDRCCQVCNNTKVIPARLQGIFGNLDTAIQNNKSILNDKGYIKKIGKIK